MLWKNNLYIILLVVISITISNAQECCQSAKSSETSQAQPTTLNKTVQDTLYYEVFGMDCPGCHSMLEKHINKLSSVQESKADWVKQQVAVVVKADSVLNENVLNQAVENANFTPGKEKTK